MQKKTTRFAYGSLALVVSLAGCGALLSWLFHSHNGLLTVGKTALMAPDTAVGFLLAGGSLWLLQREKRTPYESYAGWSFVLGSVAYFVLRHFHALQAVECPLFCTVGIFRNAQSVYTMVPETALCFGLWGCALLLGTRQRHHLGSLLLAAICGTLINSLGMICLLNYWLLLRAPNHEIWLPSLLQMAPETAILFCLLGLTLCSIAWRRSRLCSDQLAFVAGLLASLSLLLLFAGVNISLSLGLKKVLELPNQSAAYTSSVQHIRTTILASYSLAFCLLFYAAFLAWKEMQRRASVEKQLRGNEGKLEGCVRERTKKLTEEIEQRRLINSAYRETQQQLRNALKFSRVAAWSWNPAEESVTWNGPVKDVFGVTATDLNSYAKFLDLIYPDDRHQVDQLVQDTATHGVEYNAEFRIVLPDGAVRWIAGHGGAVFEEGRLLQLSGINYDIDQRKRMEMQLKESESQFRQLANSLPQIIWMSQPDGYVDYYNERWYEFTGFLREAGGDESWKPILHPDDVEPCLAAWHEAIRTCVLYQIEFRLWDRFRNEYRWHLSRALPLRNGTGKVVRWFGTCTDIHEQKTAKEILEREVEMRTTELQTSYRLLERKEEQLRQSLREKETLLKEVHHRVKNNLQVISSLLRMQSKSLHDSQSAAALEDSRRRVYSMSLIHEQLYGNQNMDRIDFREYVQTLVRQLCQAYSCQSKNLESRFDLAAVELSIDQAVPCGLILNELVTNALKYAHPGGRGGQICVELSDLAGEVALSVSDDGIGLPEGFEPKSSKSLGLTIVNILAKQLGGSLQVRTQPGAQFTVRFPRQFMSDKAA